MPQFDNVLEIREARDKTLLQIGMSLFNIEPDRPVFEHYRDLPAVGSKYVLLEAGTTSKNGIDVFGTEVYYNLADNNYIEDTVIWQNQAFRITAASDDPEGFLLTFKARRQVESWVYEFFGKENVGVISIGDITDTSVPVDNGGYEVRYSCTLVVNYLSKTTVIGLETLAAISGSVAIAGTGDTPTIESDLEADRRHEDEAIYDANKLYELLNYDLPVSGGSTWWQLWS